MGSTVRSAIEAIHEGHGGVSGGKYAVGSGEDYATVEAALRGVFQERGAAAFSKQAVIILTDDPSSDIVVRETGNVADDFDSGDGAGWTVPSDTGLYVDTPIWSQSALRKGGSGYAPRFTGTVDTDCYAWRTVPVDTGVLAEVFDVCLLYTSPSPRD